MVDPARVVAFVAAVDHAAGAEGEEESMEGIVRIGRMAAVCFLGADARAAVFNDARTGRDLACGEDAIAVQLGAADDVPGLDRGCFGGHWAAAVAVRRNRIISAASLQDDGRIVCAALFPIEYAS
ncbi:hypothetical protein D9M69_704730 [compost metagenome]